MKWAHRSEDVPTDRHFAILKFSKIWIEGDERSKQFPGHGYPGHDKEYCEYIIFENEKILSDWIVEHPNEKYVVLDAKKAKINIETNVKITT